MAKDKKACYEISTYTGQLRAGGEIEVVRTMAYRGENANFKPFLAVPHKELEQRLKESMAAEKKIYDELQKLIGSWEVHGAETLLLEKAIEYLKTEQVKNTSNIWQQNDDGTWEISNLVYRMTFKIVKSGDEWKLSWELQFTAPGKPSVQYYSYYDRGPKKRIEYEGSKKYKTLVGAQNYIQSKFDQYAHYFEVLSPPIPESVKSLFCVNGQLLQGYSVARPEAKNKEVKVDDLLACLDFGADGTPGSERTTQRSANVPPSPLGPKHTSGSKKPHHKKPKSAMER